MKDRVENLAKAKVYHTSTALLHPENPLPCKRKSVGQALLTSMNPCWLFLINVASFRCLETDSLMTCFMIFPGIEV